MTFIKALVVLLFTSPVDFMIMHWRGEYWPHKPDLSRISPGSWYHKAKGYWAESFRSDGEWWSKLCRFVIWWLVAVLIVILLN